MTMQVGMGKIRYCLVQEKLADKAIEVLYFQINC